jgi:hypothetical protein
MAGVSVGWTELDSRVGSTELDTGVGWAEPVGSAGTGFAGTGAGTERRCRLRRRRERV